MTGTRFATTERMKFGGAAQHSTLSMRELQELVDGTCGLAALLEVQHDEIKCSKQTKR